MRVSKVFHLKPPAGQHAAQEEQSVPTVTVGMTAVVHKPSIVALAGIQNDCRDICARPGVLLFVYTFDGMLDAVGDHAKEDAGSTSTKCGYDFKPRSELCRPSSKV